MKLLIVTSLREYQKTVSKIFEQAHIMVFSATETVGFKEKGSTSLMESWTASSSDQFDSIFLFSFTEDKKANYAMELINEYNTSEECKFPIRAFIVPVEKSSN